MPVGIGNKPRVTPSSTNATTPAKINDEPKKKTVAKQQSPNGMPGQPPPTPEQTRTPASPSTQASSRKLHQQTNQRLAGQLNQSAALKTPASVDDLAKNPALLLQTAVKAQTAGGTRQMRKKVGQALAKNPAMVDQLLAKATPAEAKALGQAGLAEFTRSVSSDPSKKTAANFTRAVKLLEAVDPRADVQAVSRELRRVFYSDDARFMNLGNLQNKTGVSNDFKTALNSAWSSFRKMQEVTGPDGKPMDIAHSLVSVDARANNPITGRARASLYTDVGDQIQGALNAVGIDVAGDANPADLRGNDFGEQAGNGAADSPTAKLSTLLETNLAPDKFLKD